MKRNKFIYFFIAAYFTCGLYMHTQAQEVRNSRIAGSSLLSTGASLNVSDDKFTGSSGWVSGFVNASNYARVNFGLNEDLHVAYSSYWRAVVTFDATYTDASLANYTFAGQQLQITYDPATHKIYTDKAQLSRNGYYRMDITNITIQTYNLANTLISNPSELYLEGEIGTNRIYTFSPGSSSITYYNQSLPGNNEQEIKWDYIAGADQFELEWTYVDDYTSTGGSLSTGSIYYDLAHDATRIITPFNFYRIPLTYERGYLVYRIRPVGRTSAGVVADGAWVGAPESGKVDYAQTTAPNAVCTLSVFQGGVNWNAVKTFAEDGKQGTGISYQDGLLYNRQSIARLNTDAKSIAQSTLYDRFGRATISMLPAPVSGLTLAYITNLNKVSNGTGSVIFDNSTFGGCGSGSCAGASYILDTATSVGAANYYSGSNSNKSGFNGYIPSAKGIPYTQVLYMADGTGRPISQTLPGTTHQLNSGHETKYGYSVPAQVELDRLFGTEAGKAIDGKKNYVTDANGQTSVAYLDKYGRTVATALSGDEPPSLYALDDKTTAITLTDSMLVSNKDLSPVDYCLEMNGSFYVSAANEQQAFTYSTTLNTFMPAACSTSMCLDCAYDLTLSIKDDCGNEVFHTSGQSTPQELDAQIGTNGPYISNCSSNNSVNGTIYTIGATPVTITFPHAGTYSIYKKLCVSDAPLNDYLTLYLNSSQCNANSICHYADSLVAATDFSGCGVSCATCGNTSSYESNVNATTNAANAAGNGPYYPPIPRTRDGVTIFWGMDDSGNPIHLNGDNSGFNQTYQLDNTFCNKFCNVQSSGCDFYKKMLMEDFAPGGQYGATSSSDPGWAHSVYNTANDLQGSINSSPPAWNNPPVTGSPKFRNDNGNPALITLQGITYPAQSLPTVSDFTTNYQMNWGASFLPSHPEYCKLAFYCSVLSSSMNYDNAMMAIDNYADACAGGYLNPVSGLGLSYAPSGCSTGNTDPVNSVSATYFTTSLQSSFTGSLTAGSGIYAGATSQAYHGTPPSGHSFGADICGADQEWIQFRKAYLSIKGSLYDQLYSNYMATSPSGCYSISGYGASHFGNIEDTITKYYNSSITLPPSGGMTSTYTTSISSGTSAYVASQCSTNCDAYKAMWKQDLINASCSSFTNMTTAQQDQVLSDMSAVCQLGCDVNHPMGSSTSPSAYTIPGSGGHTVTSLQGVMDYYFSQTTTPPACDALVFSGPQPYTYSGSGSGSGPLAGNLLDKCGCDKILQANYDYSHISPLPAGVTSARKMFQYENGFDLPDYNWDNCACSGIASSWAPGHSWTTTEINNLATLGVAADSRLSCGYSDCVTCTELSAALTAMGSFYNITPTTHAGYAAFMDNVNNQNLSVNYLNQYFNASYSLLQYQNLLADCDQYTATGTLNSLTYNVQPQLAELQLYLQDMAHGGLLATDHSMSLCLDKNYFLSSLYKGPLPFSSSTINYYYDATVTGSQLTIQLKDANASYAVLCTITLNLGTGTALSWGNINNLITLQVYAGSSPTAGNNYGLQATVSDGTTSEIATGSNSCWITAVLGSGTGGAEPELCKTPAPATVNKCAANLIKNALSRAQTLYNQHVDVLTQQFIDDYHTHCLSGLQENLLRSYSLHEYHYTLYYYDQGGNLTRTIAPKGVNPLAITNALGSTVLYPDHSNPYGVTRYYENLYHFNSYNQPDTESTVDGGLTAYHYDLIGRIITSQNAKQAGNNAFSYTQYDNLGRISEVGEATYNPSTASAPDETLTENLYTFGTYLAACTRAQVISTYYDDVFNSTAAAQISGGQLNLRNRVAAVTFEQTYDGNPATYDNASHYSYDEHGNVKAVLQENPVLTPHGQQYKLIYYTFDLISGNVTQVDYQPGQADRISHYYEYDADNRLHKVFTSLDEGVNKDQDAKYFYYQHGPLARTETGDKKVQGSDYFYTLQGWIKGYNSNILTSGMDPGKDAANTYDYNSSIQGLHKYVALDAASYNLNYYRGNNANHSDNDYIPVKTYSGTDYNPMASTANLYASGATGYKQDVDAPDLYNGNITSMVSAIINQDANVNSVGVNISSTQMHGYRYDQLHRIKQMKAFHDMNYGGGSINSWNTPVNSSNYDDSYLNQFSYDENGNILTQLRNGPSSALRTGSSLQLDNLSYTYYDLHLLKTNKLVCVSDGVSSGNYTDDVDDQSSVCTTSPTDGGFTSTNYAYDAIGNLVSDKQECIASIEWTTDRKVSKITRDASLLSAAGRTLSDLEYIYDGMRRRICKIEKVRDASTKNLKGQLYWNYTYYTYDASGNVMAAYTRNFSYLGSSLYSDAYNLHEQDIYGSKRLGLNHNEVNMATAYFTSPPPPSPPYPPLPTNFTSPTYETHADDERVPVHPIFILPSLTSRTLGNKEYEFTNHLSNVLTTTSDRKLQNAFGVNPGGGIVSYYEPDILTTTDYYPFGAPMAGRTYAFSNPYRYAMNGQEREPEALAGSFSAEYWMYDSRLGRRWNIDPIVNRFESPYATFHNNPIYFVDLKGLTGEDPPKPNEAGHTYDCGDGTHEVFNGQQYVPSASMLPQVTVTEYLDKSSLRSISTYNFTVNNAPSDRMGFWIEKLAVSGGFVAGGEFALKRFEFTNNPGFLWDNSAMTTLDCGVTIECGIGVGLDEGSGSIKVGPWDNPYIPIQQSNNLDYGIAVGPVRVGGNSDWAQNDQSKNSNGLNYSTVGIGVGAEVKSPLKNVAPSLGFPSSGSKVISAPKARTMKDSVRTAQANPEDSTTKAFYKRHPEYKSKK